MTVDSFLVKIDYFFGSFCLFCGLNFPGVSYVLNARRGGGPKGGHAATVPPALCSAIGFISLTSFLFFG